ncbi:hypothetical protein LZC95_26570 [Pendulispora brunnea]|uniref:Transposase n=1 Tax=Pendulispora brunnea TaxID=2905690 RepID=A0ABZ2JYM9_9BACT
MANGTPGKAEARWRVHVEKWKTSGLIVREFASQEQLSIQSLWAWTRRLLGVTRKLSKPKFVPIVVTSKETKPEKSALFELRLPTGTRFACPPTSMPKPSVACWTPLEVDDVLITNDDRCGDNRLIFVAPLIDWLPRRKTNWEKIREAERCFFLSARRAIA